MDIIDFHCDLLGSIIYSKESLYFDSPQTNCSLEQLEQGGVRLQTFAIYTDGEGDSVNIARRQLDLFEKLLGFHNRVSLFNGSDLKQERINLLLAIENLSSFLSENEYLDLVFDRLSSLISHPLYVSLTWRYENRFGGGDSTDIGLKSDGKIVLQYLAENGICIDLSHTSDRLAFDILNYIHKEGLNLTPIASHSNFRDMYNVPRNLSYHIAKEIVALGGVIGLCFVKRFVGDSIESFYKQIEYATSLGLDDHLVLGSDFYGALEQQVGMIDPFFREFRDASRYQEWISFISKRISRERLLKITHQNALNFLRKRDISKRYVNT